MKLTLIQIRAFGKLSDLQLKPTDGVNVILRENGWGKSTLSAFLTAMFWGLPDNKKKAVAGNPRKFYLPWSGGDAGGAVEFENHGKIYRLERSFGKKPSADRATLFCVTDRTEVPMPAVELGESLFGIDREGFINTAQLNGKMLDEVFECGSVRDRICASVGEDAVRFDMDAVLAKIEDERRFYLKTGARGRIPEIEAEIRTLTDEIENLQPALAELQKKKEHLIRLDALYENALQTRRQTEMRRAENAGIDRAYAVAEGTLAEAESRLKAEEAELAEREQAQVPARKNRGKSRIAGGFAILLILCSLVGALLISPYFLIGCGVGLTVAFAVFGKKNASPSEDPELSLLRRRVAEARENAEKARAALSRLPKPTDVGSVTDGTDLLTLSGERESLREQIRVSEERLEVLPELVRRKGELTEEKAKAEERLKILVKTAQYLKAASDTVNAQFVGPTKERMACYMERVGLSGKALALDREFAVGLTENAETHSSEWYSQGTKELLSFCLRLSLFDVIFEKNMPFLLLDDPFASLDAVRLAKAKTLLEELGCQRQIFYFTCSNERCR